MIFCLSPLLLTKRAESNRVWKTRADMPDPRGSWQSFSLYMFRLLPAKLCVTQLVCIVHSVGFFLNTDSTMHDGEVWKVIVKQRNWARDFLSRTCARECKGASKIIKACCKKRSGWRSDGSDGSGSGSFVSDLFPMHFYDADPPTKLLSFGVPAARL